jgi:hypothetical protein
MGTIFLSNPRELQPHSASALCMAHNSLGSDLPFFYEKINLCLDSNRLRFTRLNKDSSQNSDFGCVKHHFAERNSNTREFPPVRRRAKPFSGSTVFVIGFAYNAGIVKGTAQREIEPRLERCFSRSR